jgi:uncharacterized protein
MFVALTEDMRAIIRSAHLCFAATVTPDGQPNVSPKGTIRPWDDHSVFFLDIASPQTRANLSVNPWIELNVVDQLSRRGYRFSGLAAIHTAGKVFDGAVAMVAAVVLIEIARAAPLISPGYWHVLAENAMRTLWRERRRLLDDEFDRQIVAQGPFRLDHQ